MGRRAMTWSGDAVAAEAARIICEEAVADYRSAKVKAAQRLGLIRRGNLPDNARIERAVIDYQRLFGGAQYAAQLAAMRKVALQAMRLLAEFSPRLVGAVASGAVTRIHRVQLHLFADAPEAVDVFLADRGIQVVQDERGYRYPDGRQRQIPLARFQAGEIGVDAAVFPLDELRWPPLSPTDGNPVRRLDLAAAESLAEQAIDVAVEN